MTRRDFDRDFEETRRSIQRQNRIIGVIFWLIFVAAVSAMAAAAYLVIWSPETIGRIFGRIVAGFRSAG